MLNVIYYTVAATTTTLTPRSLLTLTTKTHYENTQPGKSTSTVSGMYGAWVSALYVFPCVCVFAWGTADIFLYDALLRQETLSSQQHTHLLQRHRCSAKPLRGPQQWRTQLWLHPLRLKLQFHPRLKD